MELRRVLFRSPEVPDVAGDLRCRLGIDVPAGGEVAVEVSFDGGDDCLRQPATAADEALIQAFLTFAKDPTAGAAAEVPFADEVALGLGREIHAAVARTQIRSEEHTSELQSLMRISYAVFCLKKKKHIQ